MKKYRIQVFGKVQGVAFRYYTKKKADELGLMGNTENQTDGSVLTYVVGEYEKLDLFVKWCHDGSPASNVSKVIAEELSMDRETEYVDFSILR